MAITLEASHATEVTEQAFARFRHTRNSQHRPGPSVHRRGVHRCRAAARLQTVDGRQGRVRDNLFFERLRHIAKYEWVYLRATTAWAKPGRHIALYMDWFNTEGPHSDLDRTTPDQAYQELMPKLPQAA